jgi:hypothetical protein
MVNIAPQSASSALSLSDNGILQAEECQQDGLSATARNEVALRPAKEISSHPA